MEVKSSEGRKVETVVLGSGGTEVTKVVGTGIAVIPADQGKSGCCLIF